MDVNGTLTLGANATLELFDLGGGATSLTEYVLFTYTGADPTNAVWTIDATAVPHWDGISPRQ